MVDGSNPHRRWPRVSPSSIRYSFTDLGRMECWVGLAARGGRSGVMRSTRNWTQVAGMVAQWFTHYATHCLTRICIYQILIKQKRTNYRTLIKQLSTCKLVLFPQKNKNNTWGQLQQVSRTKKLDITAFAMCYMLMISAVEASVPGNLIKSIICTRCAHFDRSWLTGWSSWEPCLFNLITKMWSVFPK